MQKLNTWVTLILIVVAFPIKGMARVFDFSGYQSAAYFHGTAGTVSSGDQFFADSSGASTSFSDSVDYNFGGELGFMFAINPKLAMRIGIEFVQTKGLQTTGKDSGGTAQMDVESQTIVVNPQFSMEWSISSTGTSRTLFFIGGGYGTGTISNNYVLTTGPGGGTTTYPSADPNYKEAVTGTSITSHVGYGWEFYFLDNVTMLLDLGYRYMSFTSLKYKSAANTVHGSAAEGASAKDNLGRAREFDLGGPFVGIGFRFYIPQM